MVQSYHNLDHDLHAVENQIHERAMELNLENKKWEIELRDAERDIHHMHQEIDKANIDIKVRK
jgi:hypothetical protein